MSDRGDWALWYARTWGWRVVPSWTMREDGSCECALGAECRAQGKHPRVSRWQEVASKDPAVIEGWWDAWPHANVSVVTGEASGVFVVDVDPRHGGAESMDDYERSTEVGVPATMRTMTGGGGAHLFFRWPAEGGVRNRVDWLPGVDVRGEGGQVVVPPSSHRSGGVYSWAAGLEEGPAEAPAEMVRLILHAPGGGGGGGGGGRWLEDDLPSTEELEAEGVAEGRRNDVLFRLACRLRRELMDSREAVEARLREFNLEHVAPPLGEAELGLIVDSAFRQDHTWEPPRGWDALRTGYTPPVGARVDESVAERLSPAEREWESTPGGGWPLNDYGAAMRLLSYRGREMLHVAQARSWLRWDGRRWVMDDAAVERWAREYPARHVDERELPGAESARDQDTLARWALRSQDAGKIAATLKVASAHVTVRREDLDADPWLLNTLDGVMDLRSLRVSPHSPSRPLTKLAPARWLEGAEAPAWRAFLEKVIPDQATRWWLQKAVGYTLTGATDAGAIFFLYGAGANGKSTLLEALRDLVFGSGEYATTVDKSVIVRTREQRHSQEVARLAGARFVTVGEEIEDSERLNVGRMKGLTGGDVQSAHFMRENSFNFVPQCKLWIATNSKPVLTTFDNATRRRVRLVRFGHTFTPDEARPATEVKQELEAEAAGVFGWAVEGLRGYHAEGLEPPSAVVAEVDEWMSGDDAAGRFLDDRFVVLDPGSDRAGWIPAVDVFREYEAWAALEHEPPVSKRTLMRDLERRSYIASATRSIQGRRGAVERTFALRRAADVAGGLRESHGDLTQ